MAKQNLIPASACDVCHGTGWQIYKVDVSEDYGMDTPFYVDFAKKCWKCLGMVSSTEDMTGVPDNLRDADISKFDFGVYSKDMAKLKRITDSMVGDFAKWEGKGLYLWSKTPGSGKTFLACCLGKSIMIKNGIKMRFITAPGYMDKVSAGYKRESGTVDPSETYRTCDLLILDDLGTQLSKEWQNQEMWRLFNNRLSDGRTTIITSNYPIDSLNLEDRSKDRLHKIALEIQMPEESIRKKKSDAEQAKFVAALGL